MNGLWQMGLQLNTDKTNIMHFKLNYLLNSSLQISCCETNVKQAVHTKFLGLNPDDHVNLKTHTDKTTLLVWLVM